MKRTSVDDPRSTYVAHETSKPYSDINALANGWPRTHMTAMEAAPQTIGDRPTFRSIFRGIAHRCPNCGEGALYRGYLKAVGTCDRCGESFVGMRTDDAAPWLTMVVVGHIVLPLLLLSEKFFEPPTWVQMVVWIPVALVLTFLCLPRAKGAILGLMWSKGLQGDERQ